MAFKKIRRSSGPVRDWLSGDRSERCAVDAWRSAVGLPLEFVTRQWWQPIAFVIVPVSIFIPIYLGLEPISALVIAAGAAVAVVYSAILHFFGSELWLRPVVEDIAERLPHGFSGDGVGAPLRWKLLGALPYEELPPLYAARPNSAFGVVRQIESNALGKLRGYMVEASAAA